MNHQEILQWLLDGDVSIQYQVHRDLLNTEREDLKSRIACEGWGKRFLECRHPNGHWGRGFYQPKWTSTHYTLLDLKNLGISNTCVPIRETLKLLLENEKGPDGGLNPSGTIKNSDVCINGMALNYLAYFNVDQKDLESLIDFILSQRMQDGGFNCHSNRKGAHHSSLHTTLSVLEGILEYKINGYNYRLEELLAAEKTSQAFILQHRLYKSDKTGKVINEKMLRLSYPCRWKYDTLKALDYFRMAKVSYDERMKDALDVLLQKKNKANTWNLQAHYPGQVHFKMEEAGKPSRWNTLRAWRVLKHFDFLQ